MLLRYKSATRRFHGQEYMRVARSEVRVRGLILCAARMRDDAASVDGDGD